MIQIKNLNLIYGEKVLISNLNFDIESGEILEIKGKNGSGKTTLLRALGGLIDPKSGSINVGEQNIFENRQEFFADFSFLGHKLPLDPNLTVNQHQIFWAKFSQNELAVKAASKYWNLDVLSDFLVSKLSSGFQRRLAFSKLMIDNRLLWLLDEPFAFLDEIASSLLVNLINTRVSTGGIVILTSNQKNEGLLKPKELNIDHLNSNFRNEVEFSK